MKEARELVECSREDANNYSKILSAIGMEEEGDPVGEVASMKSQLDACCQYLKEGETPAECLARNRMDIGRLMGFLATEKAARDTLQEDAARYRWLRMNRLWLKANLPMLHVGEFDAEIDKARAAHEVAG